VGQGACLAQPPRRRPCVQPISIAVYGALSLGIELTRLSSLPDRSNTAVCKLNLVSTGFPTFHFQNQHILGFYQLIFTKVIILEVLWHFENYNQYRFSM
jgi:uncharacterized membrane protein